MIELGKIQTLEAVRLAPQGVYLTSQEHEEDDEVLLPRTQMPEDLELGDMVEVFVYNDSKDRIIATMTRPHVTLGQVAMLAVAATTDIGAFLYWGLEKDLFLPYSEQTRKVKTGDHILVLLYLDKSERLCATMKIYDRLSSQSPYRPNVKVHGLIYNYNPKIGFFVAVDNRYHGLILNKEMYGDYDLGDTIEARIKKVRPDGKLELSLRDAAHVQIDGDAKVILDRLLKNNGKLNLNDNSAPEKIKSELKMSKKAFKRAVGRLLKEGAIAIKDDGIHLTWK